MTGFQRICRCSLPREIFRRERAKRFRIFSLDVWLADYIGSFLNAGGNGVYFFHYLPLHMEPGCNGSPGTFGMFTINGNYEIQQSLAQFFVAQMINREWVQPDGGAHKVYAAKSDVEDGAGHDLVTAYAVKRPDGQWSLMLVNRDQEAAHKVRVAFRGESGHEESFAGPVDVATFGSAQYQWHPSHTRFMAHAEHAAERTVVAYTKGWADPDGPIARSKLAAEKYVVRFAGCVGGGDSGSRRLALIDFGADLGDVTSARGHRHPRSLACAESFVVRRRSSIARRVVLKFFAARRLQDKVVAIVALQSHDGRSRGTEDAHSLVPRLLEPLPERPGPLQRVVEFVAADQHVGKRRVWRIVHPAAELEFFFVEADEVVACGELHGVVILKVGLKNNFSRRLAAPARPATWVSNWKVRSAARKSGRPSATSAPTTPTSVTP